MAGNEGSNKKNSKDDQLTEEVISNDGGDKKLKIKRWKFVKRCLFILCAIVGEFSTGWLGLIFSTVREPDNIQSVLKLTTMSVFWVALTLILISNGMQIYLGNMFVKARADLVKIMDSKVKILYYMDELFENSEVKKKEYNRAKKHYEWLEEREKTIREVM